MNKLLVVLLAVCLVSVHAFVKRDAPAPAQTNTALENFGKDLQALSETVKNEWSKALDPEKIKTDFNSMVDKLQDAVKSLTPKEEAPKA
ncbi:uncharacterized protein [Maniola hyperantus]|uniref:uncharacterized protein n=1 Tax=Aphantopus hyperantus TaxID=2795564 RepID=UPI003747D7EF